MSSITYYTLFYRHQIVYNYPFNMRIFTIIAQLHILFIFNIDILYINGLIGKWVNNYPFYCAITHFHMHLVQIHGFCFIVEFIALILLLLYVFDYYFNIFFHILICKYISLIINLFDLKWFAYHLYCFKWVTDNRYVNG
jgi:hypothetical protein